MMHETNDLLTILTRETLTYIALPLFNPRCLSASYKMMEAAAETFIESALPNIGIIILASDFSSHMAETPVVSAPVTIAEGPL